MGSYDDVQRLPWTVASDSGGVSWDDGVDGPLETPGLPSRPRSVVDPVESVGVNASSSRMTSHTLIRSGATPGVLGDATSTLASTAPTHGVNGRATSALPRGSPRMARGGGSGGSDVGSNQAGQNGKGPSVKLKEDASDDDDDQTENALQNSKGFITKEKKRKKKKRAANKAPVIVPSSSSPPNLKRYDSTTSLAEKLNKIFSW